MHMALLHVNHVLHLNLFLLLPLKLVLLALLPPLRLLLQPSELQLQLADLLLQRRLAIVVRILLRLVLQVAKSSKAITHSRGRRKSIQNLCSCLRQGLITKLIDSLSHFSPRW